MKARSLWIVLGLGGLVVYGACRTLHHDDDAEVDANLLHDRLWLESMPEKRTDYVQGFFVVSGADGGVFSRSSNYDLHLEIFELKESKSELGFKFPQSGKSANVKFTVKTCSEKKGFDLCLDLSENPWGGPKRYYASKEQRGESEAARAMGDEIAREAPKP
jgi:hypothetical protein